MSAKLTIRHAVTTALRPLSKVHPQEATMVVLMTLVAFMLLTAYYLLKTVREPLILLQGASRVEKFVGKTAIDTVAVRVGAIVSAVMVYVGTRFGWSTGTFAAINVGLVAEWIGFVLLIGREHRRRSADPVPCGKPIEANQAGAL